MVDGMILGALCNGSLCKSDAINMRIMVVTVVVQVVESVQVIYTADPDPGSNDEQVQLHSPVSKTEPISLLVLQKTRSRLIYFTRYLVILVY